MMALTSKRLRDAGFAMALATLGIACGAAFDVDVPAPAPAVPNPAAAAATSTAAPTASANSASSTTAAKPQRRMRDGDRCGSKGATVQRRLATCLATMDAKAAAACFEKTAVVLDCGLHAEAYVADESLEPFGCAALRKANPSATPDPSARAVLHEGQKLACLLRETKDAADLAIHKQKIQDAAQQFRRELSNFRALQDGEYSLVARGGVSLGNWQAGFLFYLSELLKARRERTGVPGFSTVTGASAGALNAMSSALASCEKPRTDPETSLYFNLWLDLGLYGRHGDPGLLPGDEAQRLGIFNPKLLGRVKRAAGAQLSRRDDYLRRTSRGPCEVHAGLTTTYLDNRDVPVHIDRQGKALVTVKRLKERFALRFNFDANGEDAVQASNLPPRFLNPNATVAKRRSDRQFYSLLGHPRRFTDPLSNDTLLDAMQASAAFPVAFPPVKLPHTDVLPNGEMGDTHDSLFVDGGALDNTPIGLAIKIDEWRSKDYRDKNPYFVGMMARAPRTYLFIDPDARGWKNHPTPPKKDDDDNPPDILETYIEWGSKLVGSSLQASLLQTVERWPFIQHQRDDYIEPRLSVPRRHLPIAGARLGHFMAFLERDFRRYDFYVGMADAAIYASRDRVLRSELRHRGGKLRDPYSVEARMLWLDSPELHCLFDYHAQVQTRALPHNQRITRAELPNRCRSLGRRAWDTLAMRGSEAPKRAIQRAIERIDEPYTGEVHRRLAEDVLAAHNFTAMLAAMHNFKAWQRSSSYTPKRELDVFIEELQKAEFRYVDIHRDFGQIEDLDHAKIVLRKLIHRSTEALAEAQPNLLSEARVRLLSRLGGDLAVGPLRPTFVTRVGWVPAYGVDGHVGWGLGKTPFRVDVGARMHGVSTLVLNDVEATRLDLSGYTRMTAAIEVKGANWLTVEPGVGMITSYSAVTADDYSVLRMGVQSTMGLTFAQRVHIEFNWHHFFKPVLQGDNITNDTLLEAIAPQERLSGVIDWQFYW